MQGGPGGGPQCLSLVYCVAQDGSGEESDTESENEIAKEKDVQVMAEEKLEEINLGTKP